VGKADATSFLRELNFSNEVHAKYMDAQSRARFHFGAEVEEYLESLRRDMIRGHMFDRYSHDLKQLGNVDAQVARLDRINAFYSEIAPDEMREEHRRRVLGGHWLIGSGCLLCAKSGLMHCSNLRRAYDKYCRIFASS